MKKVENDMVNYNIIADKWKLEIISDKTMCKMNIIKKEIKISILLKYIF
jgi:hypothetical protein